MDILTMEELYLKITLLEQSKETFDFKRGVIAVRKLLDNYLDSLDE